MAELKPAKCPSCGAAINIPDNLDKCYCNFCGNQIIVKKAIARAISVNIESLLELVKAALSAENFQEAIEICHNILSYDSKNATAWGIKGISEYRTQEFGSLIERAVMWFLFQHRLDKGQSKSLTASNNLIMIGILPDLYQTWITAQNKSKSSK